MRPAIMTEQDVRREPDVVPARIRVGLVSGEATAPSHVPSVVGGSEGFPGELEAAVAVWTALSGREEVILDAPEVEISVVIATGWA